MSIIWRGNFVPTREKLMHRNVMVVIGACAIVAAGSYAFLQHDRYSILLLQKDSVFIKAYKIDWNTGKVWWIGQDESDLVNDRSSIPKVVLPPEKRAIELARYSSLPGTTETADASIKKSLETSKGRLKIYGWKAQKIDDQIYLVEYLLAEGPASNTVGWVFEVNLEAQIVRPVIGDTELEKKYSDWDRNLPKKN
jgi:hypothetical protein